MGKLKQLISTVLVLTMLATSIPIKAIAADAKNDSNTSTSTDSVKPEGKIISEIKDKRESNIKYFLLDDGSYEADVYKEPIHYLENGEWRDIDNSLAEENDSTINDQEDNGDAQSNLQAAYVNEDSINYLVNSFFKAASDTKVLSNKDNDVKIKVAEKSKSKKLVQIKKDNYEIDWNIDGVKNTKSSVVESKDTVMPETSQDKNKSKEKLEVEKQNDEKRNLKNINSTVKFSNVFKDVDLEYSLMGQSLKENIILNKQTNEDKFTYNLKTKNLTPVIQKDNTIIFYDKSNQNKAVFQFKAPFMVDAKGAVDGNLKLELNQSKSGYQIVMTLDKEWINSADRAFPIKIDPDIETSTGLYSIYDTFVCSNDTENKYQNIFNRVGQTPTIGTARTYIRFELPSLSTGDMVTDAQLNLAAYVDPGFSTCSGQVNVHRVTQNFDTQNINWSTQPQYDSKITDYFSMHSSSDNYWASWDVTSMVRDWYNTGTNYGLMLEEDSDGGHQSFFSSNVSDEYHTSRPNIIIRYMNNSGLESYWTYHSQDVKSSGTGYINDYNGNLIFVHDDFSMTGNRMPVDIKHVYNSNDKSSGNDFGYGPGWRLNLSQRIVVPNCNFADGKSRYKYTDEDGTEHYFVLDSGSTYKDESGIDLKMTINSDGGYTVTDKKNNQLVFVKGGYLYQLKDSNGNTQTLSYNGTILVAVTDASGRKTQLGYSASGYLLAIYDCNNRAIEQFSYNGTLLEKITYMDGTYTKYDYDSNNSMTGVTNSVDGYKISYGYYGSSPYRVKSVQEQNIDGTQGGSLNVVYSNNETTFTDAKGRVETYQFNNVGNTVCVKDPDGSASYYKYDDIANINKLTTSSKLQKTVRNFIQNSSGETGDNYWVSDKWSTSTGSTVVNTEQKYIGDKSFKVQKTNMDSRQFYSQQLSLQKGKTYTLSAYEMTNNIVSNTGKGAAIFVNYQNADGTWQTVDSKYVSGTNSTMERQILTFTVPSDAASNTVYARAGIIEATGIAYFDNFQLEEGTIANRYNIVENADFSNSSNPTYGWTRGGDCDNSDGIASVDGRNSFMITGNTSKLKNIYQQVYLRGTTEDSYVFSGWVKGNSVPLSSGRQFGIDIGFQSATDSSVWEWIPIQFNTNSSDWQYLSGVAKPKNANYQRVAIYVMYYDNANTAYFRDIQLYKEEFGESYQYDKDGNIISTTNLAKQTSNFEYDSNNNIKKLTDPKGNSYNYTYDEKHNVNTATTAENIVYSFTYDSNGNPKTAKIGDSSLGIQSSAEYTPSGNYLSKVTDASGYTATSNYNENLGTLTSTTDAMGHTKSYDQYDQFNRLLHVKATADNQTIENTYSYNKDRLSTITTNGFNYNFQYDSLGNNTSVSVNNQTLITNDYDLKTGNLNSSTYGNGQSVRNEYDSQTDSIINRYYDGSSSPSFSYKYDAAGNLGYLQDFINGITTRYVYDNSNRLAKINDTCQTPEGNTTINTVGYDYDKNNNTNKIVDTINGKAFTTGYSYDKDNKLKSVINNNNDTISYNYDGLARLETKTIKTSSGTYTTGYSFFDGAPISGVTKSTTTKIQTIDNNGAKIEYTYDKNGNISTITQNGKAISYHYNELNELVREDNAGLDKTITYTYDAGGNITAKTEYPYTKPTDTASLGTKLNTIEYKYDPNWKDELASYNGLTIAYDQIGNVSNYNNWTYKWQQGRQLQEMDYNNEKVPNDPNNKTKITFKYNDSGIRTQKTVNGVTTNYRIVGNKVTYESKSNGTDNIYYTYDASGKLVSMNLNGVEYYYIRNGQNDIIGLIDGTGAQVVSYTYDSWGKHDGKPELKDASGNITQQGDIKGTLAATVGVKNPYRYRGYRYDTETGLYYLNSRYYNPEWGRFINADALAGSTGDLLSHNVFAYCKNNPVNMEDPDGYMPRKVGIDEAEMNRLMGPSSSQSSYNEKVNSVIITRISIANSKANDINNIIHSPEIADKMANSSKLAKLGAYVNFNAPLVFISCTNPEAPAGIMQGLTVYQLFLGGVDLWALDGKLSGWFTYMPGVIKSSAIDYMFLSIYDDIEATKLLLLKIEGPTKEFKIMRPGSFK